MHDKKMITRKEQQTTYTAQQQQQQQQANSLTNTTNPTPSLCQALAKILYNPAEKAKIPMATALPPEIEQGNHEYKYTLANISTHQLTHRVSQLLWRLKESLTMQQDAKSCSSTTQQHLQQSTSPTQAQVHTQEEIAFYHIGVEDNGNPLGISDRDMKSSLQTLEMMAKETNCEVSLQDIRKGIMIGGYIATVVFTRKACLSIDTTTSITIALAGQEGSGKSTMIGVLSSQEYDNGRGLARMKVLTHNHEVMTGRTSSISHTTLYGTFPTQGKNQQKKDNADNNNKMISLIDLAGHSKYLKTTLTGLVGRKPDYIAVTISLTAGMQEMTKEHIAIALYLQVSLIVIVTKMDLLKKSPSGGQHSPHHERNECMKKLVSSVEDFIAKISSGQSIQQEIADAVASEDTVAMETRAIQHQTLYRHRLRIISSQDDLVIPTSSPALPVNDESLFTSVSMNECDALEDKCVELSKKATYQLNRLVIPVFMISNVTGEGLDLIRQFFFMLPPVDQSQSFSSAVSGSLAATTSSMMISNPNLSPRSSPKNVLSKKDSNRDSPCAYDIAELSSSSEAMNQIRILGAIGRGEEATTEEEDEDDGDEEEQETMDDDEDMMMFQADNNELDPTFAAMTSAKKRRRKPAVGGNKTLDKVGCPAEFTTYVASSATNNANINIDDTNNDCTPTTKILIGKVMKGNLSIGHEFFFGPTCQGDFITVSVTSLRVNNTPVQMASQGQIATFCLAYVSRVPDSSLIDPSLTSIGNKRKNINGVMHGNNKRVRRRHLAGLVLLSSASLNETDAISAMSFYPKACWEFVGELLVINRTSPIRVNYEPVLHSGNIRQAVRIIGIEKLIAESTSNTETSTFSSDMSNQNPNEVGNQERALCRFRFVHYPEYVTVGDAFIIREDRTRGVGIITNLI